jgi:hypothetical protein
VESQAHGGNLDVLTVRKWDRALDLPAADPRAVESAVVAQKPAAVFDLHAGVLPGRTIIMENDVIVPTAPHGHRLATVEVECLGRAFTRHDRQICTHAAPALGLTSEVPAKILP